MGNVIPKDLYDGVNPSKRDEPYNFEKPSFDPNYGFSEPRQKRVMKATPRELKLAKIPLEHQDYCAHHLLTFRKCFRDEYPIVYKCRHEKHEYLKCEYEDYKMRAMEFERERRLRAREKRLLAAS